MHDLEPTPGKTVFMFLLLVIFISYYEILAAGVNIFYSNFFVLEKIKKVIPFTSKNAF